MPNTCFVISPIGDEGSPVRQLADDLYDIVISPVLKAHGFDVVRADKIARTGTIGDDVIDLIQNATLCVIDLTGHNANVYYECGRRHETGKPFIQLMKKGENLPFDLAGIRTIFYELDTPRAAHAASQEIERFVSEFSRSGFKNENSGISLATLSAAVDRIDRKLEALRAGTPSATLNSQSAMARTGGGLEKLLNSPLSAFMDAVRDGDIEGIVAIYPRIKAIDPTSQEFVAASNILASNGYEMGAQGLDGILDSAAMSADWATAVGGLARYHRLRRTSAEFLERREAAIAAMIDDVKHVPDHAERAIIANQLGILASNAEDHEKSAQYTRRAIDLAPENIVFHANLAVSLERYDLSAAEAAVDRYMKMEGATRNGFALDEAFDVYVAVNRLDDARVVLNYLESVDPGRASFKSIPSPLA